MQSIGYNERNGAVVGWFFVICKLKPGNKKDEEFPDFRRGLWTPSFLSNKIDTTKDAVFGRHGREQNAGACNNKSVKICRRKDVLFFQRFVFDFSYSTNMDLKFLFVVDIYLLL